METFDTHDRVGSVSATPQTWSWVMTWVTLWAHERTRIHAPPCISQQIKQTLSDPPVRGVTRGERARGGLLRRCMVDTRGDYRAGRGWQHGDFCWLELPTHANPRWVISLSPFTFDIFSLVCNVASIAPTRVHNQNKDNGLWLIH